jgi:endonuclease/exonuclease/phosphatase family metal-dependent hydrolase
VLVRTWNVFHGNAVPPERRGFLQEMIRLATEDEPDVLCLQELPVWALARLENWSGMRASGAVAARPRAVSAEVGRALTGVHPGLLRSAMTGQANAILFARKLRPLASGTIVLNPRGFRRVHAARLGLDRRARLAWAKERRVCQAVRFEVEGRFVTIANTHVSSVRDLQCKDAELLRAAAFEDAFAEPADVIVLAGDLNVRRESSDALKALAGPEWGFDDPIAWIDQILVRGAKASPAEPWPEERRRLGGRLLSDHSPVERTIE